MKETWLWLRGFKGLAPTNNVYLQMMALPKAKRERIFHMGPSETRGHDRSLTFQGIADAMATQWSDDLRHDGAAKIPIACDDAVS